MSVIRVGLSSFAVFVLFAVTNLQAATVNTVSGQALINRGTGYQSINGATQGNAGDSVLAKPDSSASIVYENGCIVEVKPGQVVTIDAQPPCEAGITQSPTTTQIAVGLGIAGAVAGAIIIINDNSASP